MLARGAGGSALRYFQFVGVTGGFAAMAARLLFE
jgi:hypothetical protein